MYLQTRLLHRRSALARVAFRRGWETKEGATSVEGQIQLTAENLWSEVAGRLRGALNTNTYNNWFAEAGGGTLNAETFVIHVPNDLTREWIEGHYMSLISAAVRDATGEERQVRIAVAEVPARNGAAGGNAGRPPPGFRVEAG